MILYILCIYHIAAIPIIPNIKDNKKNKGLSKIILTFKTNAPKRRVIKTAKVVMIVLLNALPKR